MRERSGHPARRALLAAAVALSAGIGGIWAKPPEPVVARLIVRVPNGQLETVAARNQLTVLEWLDDDDGDAVALVLATVPPDQQQLPSGQRAKSVAGQIERDPGVVSAEPDGTARLPELALRNA